MLSVSVIKKNKPVIIWLGITLFCILFAFIYELFSFGVYSKSMIYMFLYPLLLGVLPSYYLKLSFNRLWNDGILLLTGSSLLVGVFEIYGTTSMYTMYLKYLGITCLILGLLYQFLKRGNTQ